MCTALINPREKRQELHCDDDIYDLPRPHRHLVLNTIWALTDFTESNGATRVVPGSHLLDSPPTRGQVYETVPILMERGSVAFILGETYHCAGNNDADERRDAIIVNYCAGILRQQENFMLEVSRDHARKVDSDLQRLIGYKRTRLGLGQYDYYDPTEVLRS